MILFRFSVVGILFQCGLLLVDSGNVRPYAEQNTEDLESVSMEFDDSPISLDVSYGEEYKILVPNRPCSVRENQTIYISDSQCGTFHLCIVHNGVYQLFKFVCPNDQIFDHVKLRCSSDLSCNTLINVVKPEFPSCPATTKTYFNISIHYSSEKLCGYYTICEKEKITMYQLENDLMFNESTHSVEWNKPCCQAFKEAPIKCDEPAEQNIWHRDPRHCDRAWFCRKDREKDGNYIPHYQWCSPGQRVKAMFSLTFECEPGSCKGLNAAQAVSRSICKQPGNYANPKDCDEFYHCHGVGAGGIFQADVVKCPPGHYYRREKDTCTVGSCPYSGYPNQTVTTTTTAKPTLECTPLPPNWKCDCHQAYHKHPDACNKYYQCLKQKKQAPCYNKIHDCPPNTMFDEDLSSCVPGRCTEYDPVVPAGEGWKCSFEWETHVFPGQGDSCPKFYTCTKCVDNPYWCYTEGKCPAGQMFDDGMSKCVVAGVCPQSPRPPDSSFPCESSGILAGNPFDCSKYYECKYDEKVGSEVVHHHSCQPYYHYDAQSLICVVGNCPQCKSRVPSNLKCTEVGRGINYPNDCGKYMTCEVTQDCNQPGQYKTYWSYDVKQCTEGTSYNSDLQKCTGTCTLLPPPLENGMQCLHGEIHAHPQSCVDYIECFSSKKRNYTGYLLHTCPFKHVFNEVTKECVLGHCTDLDPGLPQGWPCFGPSILHAHPTNCRWYYKCSDCPTGKGKCIDITKCQIGFHYDAKQQSCVPGTCTSPTNEVIPRPLQPLKEGWTCEGTGASHVNPQNCSQFYVCERCQEGVQSGNEYCYRDMNSCQSGQIFDKTLRYCVKGSCNDEHPVNLPSCTFKGETHPYPADCSRYYSCEKCKSSSCKETLVPYLVTCTPPDTYSKEHHICRYGGQCKSTENTLLEGMQCHKVGDKRLFPKTEQECNQYYECVKCNDATNWCYRQWKCKKGRFFNAKLSKCRRSEVCPLDSVDETMDDEDLQESQFDTRSSSIGRNALEAGEIRPSFRSSKLAKESQLEHNSRSEQNSQHGQNVGQDKNAPLEQNVRLELNPRFEQNSQLEPNGRLENARLEQSSRQEQYARLKQNIGLEQNAQLKQNVGLEQNTRPEQNSRLEQNYQQGQNARQDKNAHLEHNSRLELNSHQGLNARQDKNAHLEQTSRLELNSQQGLNARQDKNAHLEQNSGLELNSQQSQNARQDKNAHLEQNSRLELNAQQGQNARPDKNAHLEHNSRLELNSQLEQNSRFDQSSDSTSPTIKSGAITHSGSWSRSSDYSRQGGYGWHSGANGYMPAMFGASGVDGRTGTYYSYRRVQNGPAIANTGLRDTVSSTRTTARASDKTVSITDVNGGSSLVGSAIGIDGTDRVSGGTGGGFGGPNVNTGNENAVGFRGASGNKVGGVLEGSGATMGSSGIAASGAKIGTSRLGGANLHAGPSRLGGVASNELSSGVGGLAVNAESSGLGKVDVKGVPFTFKGAGIHEVASTVTDVKLPRVSGAVRGGSVGMKGSLKPSRNESDQTHSFTNGTDDLNDTQCVIDKDRMAFPGDCTKYYECKETTDWNVELVEKKCSNGKYFNVDRLRCVRGSCETDEGEVTTAPTQTISSCNGVSIKYPDPTDCTAYYSCKDVDAVGSPPKRKTCDSMHYFHPKKRKCKKGICSS